jgi:diacylglycerol kinase (ATP)
MTIDAGEIDGRLFFNLAGIGLDARVAHRFAVGGLQRRGFLRYIEMTIRELGAFQPERVRITIGTASTNTSAMLVAIANGRQYGNGAIVAPDARLDDGRLDVIVIAERPALRALLQIPLVFLGRIRNVSGVTMQRTEAVTIESPYPLLYHLDGEPIVGMLSLRARSHPRALKIKVPAQG